MCIGSQIIAEKVIRHFEDKLRAKDSLIEKIKLKNNSLKTHIAKLDAQLRQKEEQGTAERVYLDNGNFTLFVMRVGVWLRSMLRFDW
jgi:hypothetical protein